MENSEIQYIPNTSRITYEIIEGEVIIVDFDTGVYYSINALGSIIFNWIALGAKLGDILSAIKQHYDSKDVDETVKKFIDTLLQDNIIVRNESVTNDNKVLNLVSSLNGMSNATSFQPPVLEKYTDMQELLLLDPIHEVDEQGWPFTQQDNDKLVT